MRAAKTPHGGVKTPPYGKREHGSSDRRSQQDKIARAACRPPLRPNGNSQFSIFVRNLRKVVGRGLDPAAGTSRQARRFHNKPPGFPIDVGAACTPPGNVVVARDLPGSEKHPTAGYDPALQSNRKRAAVPQNCIPSANPTGGLQAAPTICRDVHGKNVLFSAICRAGSYPAAGTSRQARRFQQTAWFSYRCRGGVYAARERCGCPERSGPRKFARRGTTPPYRVTGNGRPSRKTA